MMTCLNKPVSRSIVDINQRISFNLRASPTVAILKFPLELKRCDGRCDNLSTKNKPVFNLQYSTGLPEFSLLFIASCRNYNLLVGA